MLLLFGFGFAVGIALAALLGVSWLVGVAIGAAVIVYICIVRSSGPTSVGLFGVALGVLRLCTFFSPGWSVEEYAGPAPVSIFGRISSEPTIDPTKVTFLVAIAEIVTHKGVVLVHGTTDVLVHGAALSTFHDPQFGDNVQVAGLLQKLVPSTNPGEFDWRAHMIGRGISGELIVQRPDGATIIRPAGTWGRLGDLFKRDEKRAEDLFSTNLPATESSLMAGILFGRRAALTPRVQQEFMATGTAHILATAGLHVGILAMTLSWTMRLVPVPRKVAAMAVILLLWCFAALAGVRPAVVRAVIAATIYYAAYIFERIPDIPTTLAAAGVGLLGYEPSLLFESDFQLSFVTVIGLSLLMPFWEEYWKPILKNIEIRRLRKIVSWILDLAGLSLIAQICAEPLIAYYFNQFSLLSFPTNLVVVPLLFVIIPMSLVAISTNFISPALATLIFHRILHPLLWAVIHTVNSISSLPLSSISVSSPPESAVIGLYIVLFGAAIYFNPRKTASQAMAAP